MNKNKDKNCVFLISGTTTIIHRPHGDSMLVIRPSVNNRPLQSNLQTTKKPIIPQTTKSSANKQNQTNADLDTSSSSSTGNH